MRYANCLPIGRKAAAILLLTAIWISSTAGLSSCSGPQPLASATVLPRQLPPLPAWVKARYPVRPSLPVDLVEVGKANRDIAVENAATITCMARWYEERRAEYAQGKPAGRDPACARGK